MTRSPGSVPPATPASLFFIAAVAFTVGWTAVSSELGRLSLAFGPQILLLCNLAYFLPSLPILALQLFYDDHYNSKYGGFRSHCWRAVAGFGGCTLVAATYPFHPETRPWLLSSVTLLGVSSSIALGSCHQLAAQQPSQATVALSLGYVCSGPLLLVVEAAVQLGPECSWYQILALYEIVALLSAAGLAAQLLVQLQMHRQQHSMHSTQGGRHSMPPPVSSWGPWGGVGSDGSAAEGSAAEPLLSVEQHSAMGSAGGDSSGDEGPSAHTAASQHQGQGLPAGVGRVPAPFPITWGADSVDAAASSADMGRASSPCIEGQQAVRSGVYRLVLSRVWPVAGAVAVSVGTSMLLFPLFTYVPSSGWLGMMLPQALFWVRVFSDAAGRLVPRFAPLTRPLPLLALAALKLALTPLLVLYIRGATPALVPTLGRVSGDAAALAYVAVQWLLSGYINSCCFLAAPLLVPPHQGTKAASVMTLVFQGGCLLGLLAAVPIGHRAVPQ